MYALKEELTGIIKDQALLNQVGHLQKTHHVCTTLRDVVEMDAKLSVEPVISIDTETSGLSPYVNNIAGYVFGTPSEAWYVPVYHALRVFSEGETLMIREILKKSKALVGPDTKKVFFNYKFDLKMLRREGLSVGPLDTIEDASTLFRLFEKPWMTNKLKHLAKEYLKVPTLGEDLIKLELQRQGKEIKDKYGYATLHPALVGVYACDDVLLTLNLFQHLLKKFWKDEHFKEIWDLYRLEMRVSECCADMEDVGINVDLEYLKELKSKLTVALDDIKAECVKMTHKPTFNILASNDIIEALSERGVYLTEKTDKGTTKVDEMTLKVFGTDDLVKNVLKYRELTKLRSTYVEALLDSHVRGVVHPEFRTIEAETGRFSCARPSVQTIPKGLEEYSIRRAFVAPPGCRLFFFDFSQQELRIFGHYANDPELLKIFASGVDYHQATADMIGVDRTKAKTINFGLLYGMGAKKLAGSLGITEAEAHGIMDRYFNALPGAKRVIKSASDAVKKRGWIRTHYWRRRWLKFIDEFGNSQEHPHKALNTIIQGTCADINKICICRCSEYLKSLDLPHRGRVNLVMSIHDELVFSVPHGLEYVVPCIKAHMEDFPEFKVPLIVEVSYTESDWDSKKKLPNDEMVAMTTASLASDRVFTDPITNPYQEKRHEFEGIFDRKVAGGGIQRALFGSGRM